MSQNKRILIGIILLLVLLFGVGPTLLFCFGITKHTETSFIVSRFNYWLILAFCFSYCTKIEKQDLLLWKDKAYPVWMYPLFMIGIFLVQLLLMFVMGIVLYSLNQIKPSSQFAAVLKFLDGNTFLILLTAITAGVCEELLFRAYLQPRLEQFFKKPWIAILVTSVLFGLLHWGYGTLVNIVGTFVISLVFSSFYWKYRNIKILIMYHALYDLAVIYGQLWKMHYTQQ